jgi:hypothetical protein
MKALAFRIAKTQTGATPRALPKLCLGFNEIGAPEEL